MDSSNKPTQQQMNNNKKCSRIPIKLYPSDMIEKRPVFIINSYKANIYPEIIADEETNTNSNPINIKEAEKDEEKNKQLTELKQSLPNFKKNILEYCVEYANYTSIQGIRYMGERTRSVFERLTWLAVFCLSMYFCIQLSIQIYIKWNNSPVLVSFARNPTPIWKIPFPAVTICSETKTRTALFNFSQTFLRMRDNPENMTQEELNNISDMALICDNNIYHKGNLTTEYDSITFLVTIAPQFDELLWLCHYPPYYTSTCRNLFEPILTDEGLCFTFNMLDKSEVYRDIVYSHHSFVTEGKKSHGWTLGAGYPKYLPIDSYPRRGLSAGFHFRFVIVLRAYQFDLDYICKGPVQGFRILLHNPAEIPRVGMNYFRVPPLKEVVLAVKPNMMTTSNSLRNYEPHQRQCYFPYERYLAFFRSYSQENCELECLTNFTRAKCGCIEFHMPHEKGTPICGSGNIGCIIDARSELLDRKVKSSIDQETLNSDGPTECGCLPGCTSLIYNAEASHADFNFDKFGVGYRLNMSEHLGVQPTRINIYFKEPHFITAERNELFGQSDFIANCGGLLGLFTGFSFLSLIEILYFLSFRLLCNINIYGRHFWSGSQELVS